MPKWTEPELPMTTKTRKGGRKKIEMRYNRYGDDFLIERTQPEEVGEEMVNVGDLVADEELQIINDSQHSWREEHTSPEKKIDLEQSEIERRENTNLRILELMHGLQAEDKKRKASNRLTYQRGSSCKEETRCLVGGRQTDHWTYHLIT